MKSKTLVLLLISLSAFPLVTFGQKVASPNVPGRYRMTSSPSGIYLLDTATGEMWFKLHGTTQKWKSIESPITRKLVTKSPLNKSKPITKSLPTKKPVTKKNSTSVEIPEGMRVATVNIVHKPDRFPALRAHDLVDVYVSYPAEKIEKSETLITKMILEKVEIFAIGKGTEKVQSISVLVTPKQAAILLLAQKKGEIHIALRPPTDKK